MDARERTDGPPLAIPTTVRLVRAAQGGDADALNPLFAREEARLLAYLSARMSGTLRGLTTAEDLLQETYLRALQGFGRFEARGAGAWLAWLTTIARHVLADTYRRHVDALKRAAGTVLPLSDGPELAGARPVAREVPPGLSTVLDDRHRIGQVLDALDALDDDHREVILLRMFRGLPAEEAGREMGRSANAVRLLHARALRALAERVSAAAPR